MRIASLILLLQVTVFTLLLAGFRWPHPAWAAEHSEKGVVVEASTSPWITKLMNTTSGSSFQDNPAKMIEHHESLKLMSDLSEHWGVPQNGLQLAISKRQDFDGRHIIIFRVVSEGGAVLNLGNQIGRMPLPGGISLWLTDSTGTKRSLLSKAGIMNSGTTSSNVIRLVRGGFYAIPVDLDDYVRPFMAYGYRFPSGNYQLTAKFSSPGGPFKDVYDIPKSFWNGEVESGALLLEIR